MCTSEQGERQYLINYDYNKSNILIGAKYKSTLLENKLLALSLTRIKDAFEDKEGSLTIKIPGKEIKKIMDTSSGSFYKQLQSAAHSLMNRKLGMSDPKKEKFKYINAVMTSEYEDGIYSIRFHPDMKKHLKDLSVPFTRLSLEMVLKFKSVYSFRLYEIVKSYMFFANENTSGEYTFTKNLAELKFEMGIINAQEKKVADILEQQTSPDYDRAAEVAKEGMYASWGEFKRSALDVAVEEINDKSDIDVKYQTVSKGKGGKIVSLIFIAKPKSVISINSVTNTPELSDDEFMDEILAMMDEQIRFRDARAIMDASGRDLEAIRRVYKIAKSQKSVDNIVGFMIAGLKNDYQQPVASNTDNNTSTVKTQFHEFEQNDYDFADLENKLLNRA